MLIKNIKNLSKQEFKKPNNTLSLISNNRFCTAHFPSFLSFNNLYLPIETGKRLQPTLARLIMTGNIVAGKEMAGINMAELPKNCQI